MPVLFAENGLKKNGAATCESFLPPPPPHGRHPKLFFEHHISSITCTARSSMLEVQNAVSSSVALNDRANLSRLVQYLLRSETKNERTCSR